MKSIISIAKELLVATERPFNYILTYKFSQDHIELLFACIRGRGGSNNNPNTVQFKYAMRNLLLKNSIVASSKANVMSFNEYCTSSLFSLKWKKHRSPIQEYPQNDEVSDEEAKALSESLDKIALSDFTENIIYYIAGFVVRNVMKNIDCSPCSEALILDCTVDEHDYVPAPFSLFLTQLSSFQNETERGCCTLPCTALPKNNPNTSYLWHIFQQNTYQFLSIQVVLPCIQNGSRAHGGLILMTGTNTKLAL